MSIAHLATRAAVLSALATAGCGLFMPVPNALDYARSQPSAGGLFRVSYTSDVLPPPVSRLHAWTLHLETADGKPVDGARMEVDGDMPQHGHGLPTHPVVTRSLGNGDYVVEGMKFQMGGWWQVYLDIEAAGRHDKATFNLQVE